MFMIQPISFLEIVCDYNLPDPVLTINEEKTPLMRMFVATRWTLEAYMRYIPDSVIFFAFV